MTRYVFILWLVVMPYAIAEVDLPEDLDDAMASGTLEQQLAEYVARGTVDPGFLTEEEFSLYKTVFLLLGMKKREAIAPKSVRLQILEKSVQHMRNSMFQTNVESLLGQTALSPQAFLLVCKRYAAAIRMFEVHVARMEYRETQDHIYADDPDKNDKERRQALNAELAEFKAHVLLLNKALEKDNADCKTAQTTYKAQLAAGTTAP